MVLMIWKYFLAWFGMMILAIINGGVRDIIYKQSLGVLAAHQISTFMLLVLISGYFWLLVRLLPFESLRKAWITGILWFIMTEVFEFGMGVFSGKSWGELLQAYNLFAGQLWLLIPIWILAGPSLFFKYVQPNKHGLTSASP